MQRVRVLTLAVLCSCMVLLSATLLARAGGTAPIRGWLPPRELSQSGDLASRGPRIVQDDEGQLHVMWIEVWLEDSQERRDPQYIQSEDQGTNWSAVEQITTTQDSYQSSLAAGSGGAVHACWWERSYDQFRLLHSRRSGEDWSAAETVVITTSQIQEPSIVEASGYLNVVWSNYLSKNFDLCYTRKVTSSATWEDPVIITDTAFTSLHAQMAADVSGNLHVVWQENTDPANEIVYISGTVDAGQTTWFGPITLTADLSLHSTTPSIVVGKDDVVHVVFGTSVTGLERTWDVYHVSFPISETGGISPTIVPRSRVQVSHSIPNFASPSLAVDPVGNLHLAWNGKRGNDLWDRIYYATSQDGGANWSGAVPVSADDAWPDGLPDLVADGELLHAVWQQVTSSTDHDVYYAQTARFSRIFPLVFKGY